SVGVPSPCRVMGLSGEMGEPTLLRTAQRVGKARGLAGLPGDIIWEFGTIPLGRRQGIQALAILIRRRRARVVIIDPLYLSLLKGAKGRNPASLLDMGPLLYEIGDTCLEWGCTPVLVHHATKKVWPGRQMGLPDLAFAGLPEFARQWVLINRRAKYQSDGRHELVVNV